MAGGDGKVKYGQSSARPLKIYDPEGRSHRPMTKKYDKSKIHQSGNDLVKRLEAIREGDWGPYKEKYPEHSEEVDLYLSGQHSHARENPHNNPYDGENPQPNQATESAKNNFESNDEVAQQFLDKYKANLKYMN